MWRSRGQIQSRSEYGTEIHPEDIFLDAVNPVDFDTDRLEGQIESSIGRRPFLVGFGIVLLGILVLTGRILYLNLWRGSELSALSLDNRIFSVSLPAPRGIIYDRNREVLAKNTPSFELVLTRGEVSDDAVLRERLAAGLESLLGIKRSDLIALGFDPEAPPQAPSPEIVIASNVSREVILALEAEPERFPGIVVRERSLRDYPGGSYFFHLLGYVGKASEDEVAKGYALSDLAGKSGLEAFYEDELRGRAGKKLVEVNSANAKLGELPREDAIIGKSLVLHIDAGLQRVLYESLSRELAAQGKNAGSAVVVDPRNGEIRALVSLPSVDPSVFRGRLTEADYRRIFLNKAKPFFDRAVSGEYPSGSVIKPMIAVAALEEHVIDPGYRIWDPGYIDVPNPYKPGAFTRFPDWQPQGWVDMRSALAWSANVYFYIVGGGFKDIKGLGITKIQQYMKKFGFGSESGIDLPGEESGLVPGPEALARVRPKDQTWRLGDTYHTSIGQGFFQATPLQIAMMTAAIANGGTLWRPHVVGAVLDEDGDVLRTISPEAVQTNMGNPGSFQVAREGMRQVVTEGTGHAILGALPFSIAGKSGTAQTGFEQNTHGWFTAFAPFQDPELVSVVMAEDVKANTGIATRVTRDIYYWYFVTRNIKTQATSTVSTLGAGR